MARAQKRKPFNAAAKHIRIYRYMFECQAYRALKPVERCILQEIMFRYDGKNNGDIGLSVREAAQRVHCSKDTASQALKRLIELGFIREGQKGSFDHKARHSTRWILTSEQHNGDLATKEYAKWIQKKNSVLIRGTDGPISGYRETKN